VIAGGVVVLIYVAKDLVYHVVVLVVGVVNMIKYQHLILNVCLVVNEMV
jgi:hypothetical protein